jgi:hypothetical protein
MKTGNIVLIALGGVVVYLLAKNRKKSKNAVVVKKSDDVERDELGMPIVRHTLIAEQYANKMQKA